MDVARRQIVEEPSLVGRIKTRRNLFRFTHAQIQQSMRMGWDVIERAKSSSNSTSRFDGPLDWDFMYSLSGKNSSRPPVYEDHVPGLKSTVQVNSDDVFTSLKTESGAFDDLLGGFGKGSGRNGSEKDDKAGSDFDDLLAGLGRSTSPFSDSDRHAPHIGFSFQPTVSASKTSATTAEDPFKVFESTSAPMDSSSTSNITNPLEEISKSSPMAEPFNHGPLDWDFMYSLSGKNSSRPPFYEDHVPGLKSTVQVNSDDVFTSLKTESDAFDDLLGGFGKGSGRNGSEKDDKAGSDFDDLLAGLGRSTSPFSDSDSGSFNDLFTTAAARSNSKPRDAPFDLDFMYSGSGGNSLPSPIYAKPVYDDGFFDSVLGLKSTTKVNFDDDIASPKTERGAFDDLLGGFGKEGIRER